MLCASRQRRELKITSLESVVVERLDKGLERLKIVEEISSFLGSLVADGKAEPNKSVIDNGRFKAKPSPRSSQKTYL